MTDWTDYAASVHQALLDLLVSQHLHPDYLVIDSDFNTVETAVKNFRLAWDEAVKFRDKMIVAYNG